jgi:hypothetical protein
VRLIAVCAAATLLAAACARPPAGSSPPPTFTLTPTAAASAVVNPARIERVRGDMPPGYEFADISGPAVPVAFWGLGPNWTADPPNCGALGDPVLDAGSARGWSGSGSGGIVYAVVAAGSAPPDPALVAECGRWSVSSGHTSGTVSLVGAPSVDKAATVAMTTASHTVVEGGTETHSRAQTAAAYLGEYLAFVIVVTDPGSPNAPLGEDFAAALLVKTVAALRS